MSSIRTAVLSELARVREGTQPHRHVSFARHALRIPEGDYALLVRLFPALASTDPDQLTAAWDAFERSEFAAPYRVGRITHGIIRNGLITP